MCSAQSEALAFGKIPEEVKSEGTLAQSGLRIVDGNATLEALSRYCHRLASVVATIITAPAQIVRVRFAYGSYRG